MAGLARGSRIAGRGSKLDYGPIRCRINVGRSVYRSDRGATRTAKVNWARDSPSRQLTFTQAIAPPRKRTLLERLIGRLVKYGFGIPFGNNLARARFLTDRAPDDVLPGGSA